MRPFHYAKGRLAEDPRGRRISWSVNGTEYVADVTNVRWDRGFFFLATRFLDGAVGPEVASGTVFVVE